MTSFIKLIFSTLLIIFNPAFCEHHEFFGRDCIPGKPQFSENDSKVAARRSRDNSKFVLITFKTLEDVVAENMSSKEVCSSWGLELAEIRNDNDLKSIKNNLRSYRNKITYKDTYWISGTLEDEIWKYNDDSPLSYQAFWGFGPIGLATEQQDKIANRIELHWANDILTQEHVLVMMDVDEPNQFYERQKYLCQYPKESKCFRQSFEEKSEMNEGMEKNELVFLGEIQDRNTTLFITRVQKSNPDAINLCENAKMELCPLYPNSDEEGVQLLELVLGWIEDQGLPGASTAFWVGSTDVFSPLTQTDWEWVDDQIRDPKNDVILAPYGIERKGDMDPPGACLAFGILSKEGLPMFGLQRVPCSLPQWVICSEVRHKINPSNKVPDKNEGEGMAEDEYYYDSEDELEHLNHAAAKQHISAHASEIPVSTLPSILTSEKARTKNKLKYLKNKVKKVQDTDEEMIDPDSSEETIMDPNVSEEKIQKIIFELSENAGKQQQDSQENTGSTSLENDDQYEYFEVKPMHKVKMKNGSVELLSDEDEDEESDEDDTISFEEVDDEGNVEMSFEWDERDEFETRSEESEEYSDESSEETQESDFQEPRTKSPNPKEDEEEYPIKHKTKSKPKASSRNRKQNKNLRKKKKMTVKNIPIMPKESGKHKKLHRKPFDESADSDEWEGRRLSSDRFSKLKKDIEKHRSNPKAQRKKKTKSKLYTSEEENSENSETSEESKELHEADEFFDDTSEEMDGEEIFHHASPIVKSNRVNKQPKTISSTKLKHSIGRPFNRNSRKKIKKPRTKKKHKKAKTLANTVESSEEAAIELNVTPKVTDISDDKVNSEEVLQKPPAEAKPDFDFHDEEPGESLEDSGESDGESLEDSGESDGESLEDSGESDGESLSMETNHRKGKGRKINKKPRTKLKKQKVRRKHKKAMDSENNQSKNPQTPRTKIELASKETVESSEEKEILAFSHKNADSSNDAIKSEELSEVLQKPHKTEPENTITPSDFQEEAADIFDDIAEMDGKEVSTYASSLTKSKIIPPVQRKYGKGTFNRYSKKNPKLNARQQDTALPKKKIKWKKLLKPRKNSRKNNRKPKPKHDSDYDEAIFKDIAAMDGQISPTDWPETIITTENSSEESEEKEVVAGDNEGLSIQAFVHDATPAESTIKTVVIQSSTVKNEALGNPEIDVFSATGIIKHYDDGKMEVSQKISIDGTIEGLDSHGFPLKRPENKEYKEYE